MAIEDIDTAGMSDNEVGLHATLAVHTALLSALAATHPNKPVLKAKFAELMSRMIERSDDSRFPAMMAPLEAAFRTLL